VSRRGRLVFSLAATAAIAVALGTCVWRRHAQEQARIAAARDAAALAAIERSIESGYRSELRYFPATKVAVALQLNRDFGVNSDALMIEIARRVRDGSQR